MSEPRIILWDLETSHNVVATFKNWGQHLYIPPTNILRERAIISGAWKVLGEKTVDAVSALDDPKRYAKDPYDDYHIVKVLRNVLAQADMIIHHNGRAFDKKYLNARLIHHGFEPLPPLREIDTNLIAKRQFLFNSNSLDYLAKFLRVGMSKIHTENSLWLNWVNGSAAERLKAIKDLVTYNKHDVVVLELVFQKLRPYVQDHISRELFGDIGCPRCGSLKVQSRGVHKALTRTYARFQCMTCGGWFRDTKASSTGTKKRIL